MDKIKESEARILIYLSVVPNTKKNLTCISHKLGMDYGYCIRILQDMMSKGWILKHKHGRFMSYNLEDTAPLELAKMWYKSSELQKSLEAVEE